jgi:hypothetical protein
MPDNEGIQRRDAGRNQVGEMKIAAITEARPSNVTRLKKE